MFENEDAARTQQSAFENQFYDLFAALQVVGGVRKMMSNCLAQLFR